MLQGYFHIMEYWPLKHNIFFLINTNPWLDAPSNMKWSEFLVV